MVRRSRREFTTQFNAAITYNIRTLSSPWDEFDAKRYKASPSFTHFNMDVSHTQELPEGFQLYGKVQGQMADGPLVSSEQFSLGGLDTVRGYLRSEMLGDNGAVANYRAAHAQRRQHAARRAEERDR